ncbi:TPA: hypothetical protein GRI77_19740 [Vibrio parahaemolyticus]|uniref:hypothetical protein n=1 Tax=Vibrio parahaemolyticus TaxID=670 RepID=UPI0007A03674|nr:hypothetical protein [Vibrio parahaemolyticus]EGQ9353235.1 hypothetical protein [Vibrio parahaemolyticus]EGQ9515703.1 hypothetical protein [Vibrio parahaemolyticus]EIM7931148.1 hypothetical protein [Vibrio parahaemolyticus]EJQ8019135.1 hypothetical protein [Vibrio parahaemolyticus]EJU8977730.1 hypothetical protein [Vibrio parahaemolyticus]
MLCPSLLSSQNIDPEESLSNQQIDRSYLVERIWDQIYEVVQKRKNGLTDNDCRYFDRLLTTVKEWSNDDLLELADATPSEFRKLMRGW